MQTMNHFKKPGRGKLFFDGNCSLCVKTVKKIQVFDLFGWIEPVDFSQLKPGEFPAELSFESCKSEMKLLESDGKISGGFLAVRRIAQKLPLLFPILPFLYIPGAKPIGSRLYEWIAKNRYLFHFSHRCKDNACFR